MSVGSRFLVLPARTHFRQLRGRRNPFSCFACLDSVLTVLRASCPVFILCAPKLVFGGTDGVGYHFLVLHVRTFSAVPRASGHVFMFCAPGLIFRRYQGRRVPFSHFAPELVFGGSRASGPVFLFCAPGLIFVGTEGVHSRSHVFRSRIFFGGTEGVGSRFHVLRSHARFRRYRGRRVPICCFARPESFSAVPRASGPVF
jgi:hypothetical protein